LLKLTVEKIVHLELFRSKTLYKSDTVSINIYLCNRLFCILLCNRFKPMLRMQRYEETAKETASRNCGNMWKKINVIIYQYR